jgi:hypothetical protein
VVCSGTRLTPLPTSQWVNAKTRSGFSQLQLPPGAEAAADNLANLCETPILFFAVSALFLASGLAITDDVVLVANVFVVARALHSAVQILLLSISLRFALFLVSLVCIGKLWLDLYVGIAQM